MTFEELIERLNAGSAAPSAPANTDFRDYIKNEMASSKSALQKKPESTMSQIFQLVGSLAPVAAGALMGGGEGAAIGAGVASDSLSRQAAQMQQEQSEIDKHLRDRAGTLENLYLKSGLDAENMASQRSAKASDQKQSLMGQALMEAAKSKAAMEREEFKQKGAKDIASMKISAKTKEEREKPTAPTKGQDQLDKEFGKRYDDWVAGGGFATVEQDLKKLETEVLSKLGSIGKDGKVTADKSRNPISGALMRTGIGAAISPDRRNLLDNLESVVQKTLRTTLGGQFAEKEGQRLIERAFNPQLSDAENFTRVKALIDDLRTRAAETDRAARYFEENGTLTGFQGGGVNRRAPMQGDTEKNTKYINGVPYDRVPGGWQARD